ncbi:Noc2-domain-containing protein [Mycena floridula]|nr:Noc2-domain-containing protein [Mycena floridula]
MGKKASKSMKKFVSSGQLKKTIDARRKHQQVRKKLQNRRGKKGGPGAAADPEDDEPEGEAKQAPSKKSKMSVDDILGGGFMDESDEEEEDEDIVEDEDSDDEDAAENADFADDASFASIDELDDEGKSHMLELSKLAEKDPEFYKYLQENDRELLDFDATAVNDDDEDEMAVDDEMSGQVQVPILTNDILRKWQRALLEHRSLRALRKLLIAFRSAIYMNEEDQTHAWRIDSASVYNKTIITTLRYTPVVLEHHVPHKTGANGKFKPPTQTPKFQTLQKLILSYFHNVIRALSQLTDNETLKVAVTESAKIIPYIVSSRKTVKLYLKTCLELWSSGQDEIRIAAFLAIRTLASATDDSILDNVLKGIYLTLVRSSKSTSVHTLSSINLMKNTASEVFCLDPTASYQHAFGYIRQLAIHLRNSMKIKTKEAHKQVYNWQYVHSLDFWSLVLARACDAETEVASGGKVSDLKPLIYPLVQVCLGAIKLVSNPRSYPLHLHIIRSLLHLTKHTETYVPMAPYVLPILTSPLSSSSRPKSSTLRPLDFEVQIRVPQQYAKTRVFSEGLVEETAYLLAEWLVSKPVHGSIAFPEIIIPVVVTLRKALKGVTKQSSGGKDLALIKALVERIEDSGRWVDQRRKTVTLSPGRIDSVQEWQRELRSKVDESPLAKYLKVQRKTRDKQRKMVEKARVGEDEVLED